MNTIPYQKTNQSLTVFLDRPYQVDASEVRYSKVVALLNQENPDLDVLRDLLQPANAYVSAFDGTGVVLNVNTGTVTYQGKRISGHLERKVFEVVDSGLPVDPWKRFVARLAANPSMRAREELDLFLERGNLPITPDGCFLAYKRVTADYQDCYTRSIDNSVGTTVVMPGGRSAVDDDARRTCSVGLHFCSKEYLRNFYSGSGRIVAVKIDPADVVSIPVDYNHTKGRTWKYEVVDEIDTSEDAAKHEWGIYEYNYVDSDWEDDWDDDYDSWDEPEDDWLAEDDDFDAYVKAEPTVKEAKRTWWNKLLGRK